MHLLVGRENDLVVQIFHNIGFFQDWLPHPPFVVWNDLYKNHIEFIYYSNLLPLSYNVSAYKDTNQNCCVIGYVNVQKNVFSLFLAILGQTFLLFGYMATSNNLRERNIAY